MRQSGRGGEVEFDDGLGLGRGVLFDVLEVLPALPLNGLGEVQLPPLAVVQRVARVPARHVASQLPSALELRPAEQTNVLLSRPAREGLSDDFLELVDFFP